MTATVPAASPQTIPGRLAGRLKGAIPLQADFYRKMLFALMVMSLSRIHQHFSSFARFHPPLLFTAIAALYAVANPKALAIGKLFRYWPAKNVLYLGFAAVASVPLAMSIGGSGSFVINEYSKTLVLSFLLMTAIRHVRDLYLFTWGYVVSCAFLGWMSIFVFRLTSNSVDGFARINEAYSYDSNDLGLVVVMGLVFCFLFYEQCKGTLRLLNFGLMGVIGITIARTGSRGTLIGLAVALAGLFFVVKSVSMIQKAMTAGVLALGLALAAPAGYWDQMMTMFAPSNDYNVTSPTGRVEVWKRGLGYFASNPATGLGISNFGRAEGLISDRAQTWATDHSAEGVKWSAAHNSFIQILAEEGLPGFLLFTYLVFGGAWQMRKLQKRLPKHWEKGDAEERFLFAMPRYLPIVLLTFATSGSLVSFAYLDPMYLIAALMTGLYRSVDVKLAEQAAAPAGPAANAPPPPRRNERGGWGLVPPSPLRAPQIFTPPSP